MCEIAASDLRVGRGSQHHADRGPGRGRGQLRPTSGSGEDRNLKDGRDFAGRGPLRPTSGSGEDRNLHSSTAIGKRHQGCVRPPGRARIATRGSTTGRWTGGPSVLRPTSGSGEDHNLGVVVEEHVLAVAASDLRVGRGSQQVRRGVRRIAREAASDLRVGRGSQPRLPPRPHERSRHAASGLPVGRGSQPVHPLQRLPSASLRPTSGSGEDRNSTATLWMLRCHACCVRPPGRARIATASSSTPPRSSATRCVRPPGRARITTRRSSKRRRPPQSLRLTPGRVRERNHRQPACVGGFWIETTLRFLLAEISRGPYMPSRADRWAPAMRNLRIDLTVITLLLGNCPVKRWH